MRWPLTENQCTAALLMVVERNTLYKREWSRAELIGSSRTFQRGNDSVCTDPSFTSVQVESWLYNRKLFRPLLSAFFFPLCCNLFARMGNPAYVRLVTRRTIEKIGSHTVLHTHRGNNIPTLLLFRTSPREELYPAVPLLGSSINYLTRIP